MKKFTEKEVKAIEEKIGYHFIRKELLEQAFIRRSYSEEHGGLNNEVLELIGDKVLGCAVLSYLIKHYAKLTKEGLQCAFEEGELSKLYAELICRKTLATRVKELGLQKYLIMGAGDIAKSVQEEKSVQEDLLEAIFGAMAIDGKERVEALVWEILNGEELLPAFEKELHKTTVREVIGERSLSLETALILLNELKQRKVLVVTESVEERPVDKKWICGYEAKGKVGKSNPQSKKKDAQKEAAFELLRQF